MRKFLTLRFFSVVGVISIVVISVPVIPTSSKIDSIDHNPKDPRVHLKEDVLCP